MIVNFAMRKYSILVKKYGHDEAKKYMTKQDMNSMYQFLMSSHKPITEEEIQKCLST